MTACSILFALLVVSSQHAVKASQDDLCLRAVTYLEAGNQPTRGIAAVRQVILQRAKKRRKSVCKVVREKGQFSSVKNGMKLGRIKMSKKFLTKYRKAATMRPVVSSCVQWFHSGSKPYWAQGRAVAQSIGQHHFYC